MWWFDRWLTRLTLETIVPQIRKPTGVDPPEEFMLEMGVKKLGRRALQRRLIYTVSGQSAWKIDSLKDAGKRGLLLYFGEGQLGDALMDLAPRSLLQLNGYRIDLLTDKFLVEVFENDPWFESISDDPQSLALTAYDFAIVLSNKRRSIQTKKKYFKNLPWVSIHENFTGPNFDRSGFATQRLADLLDLNLSHSEFSHHANQKLRTRMVESSFDISAMKISDAITLCIGGVDPLRTYRGWASVIFELLRYGIRKYVLVGSSNGAAVAEAIMRDFKSKAVIHDFVGKCTVAQTHDLIAASRTVISTDGGLLHLAATTSTPIVALFSSNIQPQWRLKMQPISTFLCSPSLDVNAIAPCKIVDRVISFENDLTAG